MKKKLALIIFASGLTLLFFGLFYSPDERINLSVRLESMLAGFFAERISAEKIKNNYLASQNGQNDRKIKVLIVPGHDESSPGATYRNLREFDLTTELGEELYSLFKKDAHYETILLRGRDGYTPAFLEYLNQNRPEIARFRDEKRKIMMSHLSSGLVEKVDGAPHAEATEDTSIRLYGINKWADEIGVSIMINVHFNEFPRRKQSLPGEYSGFAIYVPDEQYGNAGASRQIAEKMFSRFSKYYPASNYPPESAGIVPDQELISLGANDTLGAASVLIEYGYLYEPQFKYPETRNLVIKDMALKTYIGAEDFFGDTSAIVKDTTILPYLWSEDIKSGDEGKSAVLALQAALLQSGFYPPIGKSKDDCPLTGSFKSCTRESLSAFQKKYDIYSDGTLAGPRTREILNALFGS